MGLLKAPKEPQKGPKWSKIEKNQIFCVLSQAFHCCLICKIDKKSKMGQTDQQTNRPTDGQSGL